MLFYKPPTPEEAAHLKLVRGLPCLLCAPGEQQSKTEAHHIKRSTATGQPLGGSQKASHFEVLPLCQRKHHWNSVYVSMGSREFERLYGNELELLERTYELLGLPYPFERIA